MESIDDKYRRQISEAWKELNLFEGMHRKVRQRVHDLRDLIRVNANLLTDEGERRQELTLLMIFKHPENITEAVKATLFLAMAKEERLTPTEIRDCAEQRGFSFSAYTNPLASIHTTLRRMREADPPEVELDESDGTYLMITPRTWGISPEFMSEVKRRASARAWESEEELSKVVDEAMNEVFERARSNTER